MNLDTGRRMSANKWIECRMTASVITNIERLAELEHQPLMFDGPSIFWHTANGDIHIPDDSSTVDDVPMPPGHPTVPLYTVHQGAIPNNDDATVVDEDIDDDDDSDYNPEDDADTDIDLVVGDYDAESVDDDAGSVESQGADNDDDEKSIESQGANNDGTVEDVNQGEETAEDEVSEEENQGADETMVAEEANQGADEATGETVGGGAAESVHISGYNLRQRTPPSFGSYNNPNGIDNINASQIKNNTINMSRMRESNTIKQLTFEHLKDGHSATIDDIQAIAYNFLNKHLHIPQMHTQMSAKKGIKIHGEKAIEALLEELAQLNDMNTFEPKHAHKLTREERREAL